MQQECYSNVYIVVLFLVVGFIAFMAWLKTPEVYIDSEGECIKVMPKTSGSCSNLPPRYTEVYVK